MLLMAGLPLQGPARSGDRSGAGGAEMGERASDGDTGKYSGPSSEEVDAPVAVGTKGGYTRWRTATPGIRDS